MHYDIEKQTNKRKKKINAVATDNINKQKDQILRFTEKKPREKK